MAAPHSLSTSPPDLGRGATAWDFGDQKKPSVLYAALTIAIGLHLSLSWIRIQPPAALPVEETVWLDTVELPEPEAAPPQVKEPDVQPEPTVPPSAVAPTTRSPAAQGSASLAPAMDQVGDGADTASEESAAEIATAASDSASAWAMLSGSGNNLSGGTRGSSRAVEGVSRASSLKARDLSRDVIPPNLEPLVERNYPAAARLARVGAEVTVSAIIRTDGTPTDIRVSSIDTRGRGFGEACSRTVHQGPAWKPRLNRDGRPVETKVTYTCRFKAPESNVSSGDGPTTGSGANRIWTRPAGG